MKIIFNGDLQRSSRFLSLVLRHKPEVAGVTLDDNGWVDIDVLLTGCRDHGHKLSRADFNKIVVENDKKRFIVEHNRVRAAQGHSVKIDLGYKAMQPPDKLYHGTATRFLKSIQNTGLKAQARQYVHLSDTMETATKVGARHGKPVVIAVKALEAFNDGLKFYLADNGVWLADAIPTQFLETVVS